MKIYINKNFIVLLVLTSLMLSQMAITKTHASSIGVEEKEDKNIKGKVTDENGQGLPGASVIIKGTTNGSTTDIEGAFSLNVPEEAVLTISYVGYKSQEIVVGVQSVVDVQLIPDFSQLEEIVVVGYGTQKKSDITGSVSSVKAKTIQQIPLARADEALQGQVAGVRIQKSDASPNAKVKIRVRGSSSVNGGNDPLVIIDGVQGTNLSDIHPNDIQSIEVLKDASATAIYGSRGASGVILVTTKKGGAGAPTVTYNVYGSIAQVRKELDLLNAADYARVNNANRLARGLNEPFTAEEIQTFEQNGGANWQDEIFQTGYSHNHHLTIAGGNETSTFSIAGDYVKTEGIVIGSSFEKFALRPNFSASFLSDKLKFSLNSFLSLSIDQPAELNARGSQGSPILSALVFSPTTAVFNEDGSYTQPNNDGRGVGPTSDYYNPVALALEPLRDQRQNQLIVSPTLSYEIVKGLTISSNLSYQQTDNRNSAYINEKIVNGSNVSRRASIRDISHTYIQNTNILAYEKTLNEHQLGFTGVFEQQREDRSDNSSWNSNFFTNSVTYNNLGLGSDNNLEGGTNAGVYSYKWEKSLRSYMGRINYSFASKYLFTITGRYDESSVFAKNNKGGFFPSVALGWNVANESFLEGSSIFTNLKLRGSYGSVGNQAISAYQSLDQLSTSNTNFSFTGGQLNSGVALSNQEANPDLKWETTKQLNIGLDMELLAGRVSLVADYYKKNTEDLLLSRALKQASGRQTKLVNAGEVLNEGFEILLAGKPVVGDLEWDTQITFAKNKNEVLSLNEGETEFSLGNSGLPGFDNSIWIEVGQPIGLIRGYEFAGVWGTDESILAASYGVAPGSPIYVDQNSDGIINGEDVVNIGNTLPEYTFGWNNFFRYKNFDLAVIVNGVLGNDIYNLGRSRHESNNDGTSTALLNAWTAENQDTDIIGHNAVPQGVFRNDSRWIEDGSYIRIKNISLGYTFPTSVLESLGGISSVRVYATGTNLFTFTNYSGYDPESNNSQNLSDDAVSQAGLSDNVKVNTDPYLGIDLASFPSQKIYTLGLDIRF